MKNWQIDYEKNQIVSDDGWIFKFNSSTNEIFDGVCIERPGNASLMESAKIAREAGEAYLAARNKRH